MTLRLASERFLTEAQVRGGGCSCIGANSPSQDYVLSLIDAVSDAVARATGCRIAGRQDLIARPTMCGMYCIPDCACGCGFDFLPLGNDRPVITQVRIDGAVINSDYWDMHWNGMQWGLRRWPNEAAGDLSPPAWPTDQKIWRNPESEADTFAIYFSQGIHVDDHIITAAALELVCDLANDDIVRERMVEGAIQVNAGNATIIADRNLQRTNDETVLDRIARGETGPFFRRMMGMFSPKGGSPSAVWSPEVTGGWSLNLSIGQVP